jgi:hypothetical protein
VTAKLTLPDGRSIACTVADQVTQAYILSAEKLREMEADNPQLAHALHYALVALLADRPA